MFLRELTPALENRQKSEPKSDLGRHISAFFKICFHVLEH
jgi:hypothetical protein